MGLLKSTFHIKHITRILFFLAICAYAISVVIIKLAMDQAIDGNQPRRLDGRPFDIDVFKDRLDLNVNKQMVIEGGHDSKIRVPIHIQGDDEEEEKKSRLKPFKSFEESMKGIKNKRQKDKLRNPPENDPLAKNNPQIHLHARGEQEDERNGGNPHAGENQHRRNVGILSRDSQHGVEDHGKTRKVDQKGQKRERNAEEPDREFLEESVREKLDPFEGMSAEEVVRKVTARRPSPHEEKTQPEKKEWADFVVEVDKTKKIRDLSFPTFVEFDEPNSPGYNGKGFLLSKDKLTKEELKKKEQEYTVNYFDEWISRMIPVHRTLPDVIPTECKIPNSSYLPSASVIIVFYNEAWTTLLRSLHSILDRTPEHLLTEIILVDDYSDMVHLKDPLSAYILPFNKVKLYRAKERLGLIRAREVGQSLAKAEVIIFLDSHIECYPGWIEPLLQAVHTNHKAVAFPVLESISGRNFGVSYMKGRGVDVGGLKLGMLTFAWINTRRFPNRTDWSNVDSPTMPGGLYAIRKDWFNALGGYDPGLDRWGGENIEMSFKTWMCGGTLQMISCSHVGHVFRSQNPALQRGKRFNYYYNSIRVAEVWMDKYKHWFYESILYDQTLGHFGNISDRIKLRNSLHCKDFRWYLDKVYPELKHEMDVDGIYAGQVKNNASNLCLDRGFSKKVGLFFCDRNSNNQMWKYRSDKELSSSDKWLGIQTVRNAGIPSYHPMIYQPARSAKGMDNKWEYDSSHRLYHVTSDRCLEVDVDNKEGVLAVCSDSLYQKWTLTKRRELQEWARREKALNIDWSVV